MNRHIVGWQATVGALVWVLAGAGVFGQVEARTTSDGAAGGASRDEDAPAAAGLVGERAVQAERAVDRSVDPARGAVEVERPGDQVFPLPAGARFEERVVVAGGKAGRVVRGGTAGEGEGPVETRLVYSNTLGQSAFGPTASVALGRIADDISTTGNAGCALDRYVIRVLGDRVADGSGVGPFSVDLALYDACPGAGGRVIAGTEASVAFPDNGLYTLVVAIPRDVVVPLPQSLYLAVQFSRDHCGLVVGAPAVEGFSMDRLDYPGTACRAALGGFPAGPHASFWAQVYVREPCGVSSAGYVASNQAGVRLNRGINVHLADDIRLSDFGSGGCNLVGYEISHRGSGIIDVSLHDQLSNADPVGGARLPGSRKFCFSTGANVQICRHELPEPVRLDGDRLFIRFTPSTIDVGPVLGCRPVSLGESADIFFQFRSTEWSEQVPSEGDTCFRAFDVRLFCEGLPPVGACCDMVLWDEDEESVCRELPKRACSIPDLWVEGGRCGPVCEGGPNDGSTCSFDEDCPKGACVGSFCVGGENDGMPCARAAGCPGGSCEGGPFAHACGLSACCKPDETCANLTRNECLAVEPVEEPRFFRPARFCEEGEGACPFMACFRREGQCLVSHEDAGCADAYCCTEVCEVDPFCCRVVWDRECVRKAVEVCDRIAPNDRCQIGWPGQGVMPVTTTSSTVLSNAVAMTDPGDPKFSCHPESPGAQGFATVWFKLVATHETAFIQTCRGVDPGVDSIIGVYRAGNPTDDDTACASLEEIACGEAALGCGQTGFAGRVCAAALTPGETYYVQLASRTEDGRGLQQLDISPFCPDPEPPGPCPPADITFVDPPAGVVDARWPDMDLLPQPRSIASFVVKGPPGTEGVPCWNACDTATERPPVRIRERTAMEGGRVRITLTDTIPINEITGLQYRDNEGGVWSGFFTSNPGNVNAGGVTDVDDVAFLVEVLTGEPEPPWALYSADCDHSGVIGPRDLLCLIDLLNAPFGWSGAERPMDTDACRRRCNDQYPCRDDRSFCKPPVGECYVGDSTDGTCTWVPVECPGRHAPVCGCDGRTYVNECFSDAARVAVLHEGPCG